MKFMILRKADKHTENGVMPSEDLLSAMGDYNMQLAQAGILLAGEGLKPSAEAARIQFQQGKPIITDGPFTETKEVLAGFTIIEVNSKEEALDWVKRWPVEDADGNVELELRQLYEMSDFAEGPGLQKHIDLDQKRRKQPLSTSSYLLFDGNCREAFEFYAEVLGGGIVMMMSGGESPMADDMPAEFADKVMHVSLQVGNWMLMGSDCPPGMFEKPQGFHVQIAFEDEQQAETTFNQLAEDGIVQMPFEPTFWAKRFGMLVDRFGTPWMINCGQCLQGN
tara:strand:- start:1620 stop:2456 length:837 start_codon:yes stop_codon:yes gene_type:complete